MFSIQGTAKLARARKGTTDTPSMAIIVDLYAQGSLDLESATIYMSIETARLLGQSLLLTVLEVDSENKEKAIAQGDGDDGGYAPCSCQESQTAICPAHGAPH